MATANYAPCDVLYGVKLHAKFPLQCFILSREKRHPSLLWKAFSISLFFNTLIFHFIVTLSDSGHLMVVARLFFTSIKWPTNYIFKQNRGHLFCFVVLLQWFLHLSTHVHFLTSILLYKINKITSTAISTQFIASPLDGQHLWSG